MRSSLRSRRGGTADPHDRDAGRRGRERNVPCSDHCARGRTSWRRGREAPSSGTAPVRPEALEPLVPHDAGGASPGSSAGALRSRSRKTPVRGSRRFERARLRRGGAGECAALVPEQLALEEGLRDRGAVEDPERRLRAGPGLVDEASEERLADAGPPLEERRPRPTGSRGAPTSLDHLARPPPSRRGSSARSRPRPGGTARCSFRESRIRCDARERRARRAARRPRRAGATCR